MSNVLLYEERVSSPRTTLVFAALTVLCLALLAWRLVLGGVGVLAAVFLLLSLLFFFSTVNYRVLVIRMAADRLRLKFGVFGWTVPVEAIARVSVDTTSLWRIGGAGIHFSVIAGRYRAMLNFLEHPRVVVELTQRRGLVRDVAFSTTSPERIIPIIQAAAGRSERIDSS